MKSDNSTKAKVFLSTYGCQMNVLDSELVQGQLETMGYDFIESAENADVVLLNTCSVRELSEHKVWSALGRLGIQKDKVNPDLVIGVLGCMAEREGEGFLQRAPQVDVICGPSNLDELPQMVDNAVSNKKVQVSLSGHNSRRSATLNAAEDRLENLDLSRAFSATESSPNQAYVRITRGCNKFCSFCVVPFTRGPEVHRPADHIVEEVKRLVDSGVVEVTLLGQTVNHYNYSDGGKTTSFADLLWKVHEEVPDLPRLRFLTSYPRDFTDDALDAMAAADRICKYLHIPAQSGSDRILKKMNRGYTTEQYFGLLERARKRMPTIRLAGDMIVGFPTETDEDHAMSMELLRQAQYKSCFIFKYSPRPGTVSIRRLEDDVPNQIKKMRHKELLDLQGEIGFELHKSYQGQVLPILVESESKYRKPTNDGLIQLGGMKPSSETTNLVGRTEGDEIVAFEGPRSLIGSITMVEAIGATALTIQGRWQGNAAAAREQSMRSELTGISA